MANKRILIIGAGQAGGHAAIAARAASSEATIVLFGEEGFPPYERPPLSKAALVADFALEQVFIQPREDYVDQRIDLRVNQVVTAINRNERNIELKNAAIEPYDKLILATGASPRRLLIPGGNSPKVLYLRTIEDAHSIRSALSTARRVVIIGAGLIGLEIAASATRLGANVTILEAASRAMQRVVTSDISEFFSQLHSKHNVAIQCNSAVSSITESGDGVILETSAGQLEADLVVVGIGAVPNQSLAQHAALKVDSGIITDEYGQTSDPAIFAVGDVAKSFNTIIQRHVRVESWKNAQDQGTAVGTNAAGLVTPYSEPCWFWSDQYDVNFQSVGWPSEAHHIVFRGDVEAGSFIALYLDETSRVMGACGIDCARDIRSARALIVQQRRVDAKDLADPRKKLADLSRSPAPAEKT